MQAPENYSYGLAHKKQKDRYIAQVVRPLVWRLSSRLSADAGSLHAQLVEHRCALHASSGCAPTFPDGCLPACDARSLVQQHIQHAPCTPLCSTLLPRRSPPPPPTCCTAWLTRKRTCCSMQRHHCWRWCRRQAEAHHAPHACCHVCMYMHTCVCKVCVAAHVRAMHTACCPPPATTLASPVACPAPPF